MLKKRLQIKDSQVRKNLKWHILRLLRLNSRTRQELLDKIKEMYVGYWMSNNELIDINLNTLMHEDSIEYSDKYAITEKGLHELDKREKSIEQHHMSYLSKEACAKYSLWGNVGLSALEFFIGFLSGSIGLIADAVHTGIDIVASAITWIGIKIDREAQSALIGGIILCCIGAFIAFESITKIFTPVEIHFQIVALVTIVINIAVNGYFSYYKFYVGGQTRSISLVADAYHTKTDIWSSVAVLIGLLGATLGFFALDAIAGVVVSFFIILGGYELIKESHGIMQGKDPKIEKFSRFLDSHLNVLQERGVFIFLWFLNLRETTKEENFKCVKKGFGKHFPVKLEDKDYESIYAGLVIDHLLESVNGKLRLTEKGKKELNRLAKKQVAYVAWSKSKFVNARKINWFSEGL
ncbi:cation diffusion facilitator family transporter [Dethiosulfatibacter aminovorans DSM 17477]|uniref:Cation diffusion facilitator family transporter n=1 Tax=Dethiosulfatibacter aminovorans DSM 17477 TaxID=1121476 RepID=A0A1M6JNR9_9FIRM|nr:cation diffusion facilitator family transporter [Dethiosulfatibacter aminovorans]SHJ48292.1 cation diffusion facilitator family transporter [Dethiosulfatibacter aminovorans DSM 17477]